MMNRELLYALYWQYDNFENAFEQGKEMGRKFVHDPDFRIITGYFEANA